MKRSFFQAAIESILLYGCTTWMLTKWLEKRLDGNCTRMMRAILNRSWKQQPTKQQLYGHPAPTLKTIQIRWTRHAGHCWRSSDELVRDVLLWTPTHGRAKAGRPARTYIQQLCEDTGWTPEDLPKAMNDKGGVAREGQGYPCWWLDKMMMRWWNWKFIVEFFVIQLVISFFYIFIGICCSAFLSARVMAMSFLFTSAIFASRFGFWLNSLAVRVVFLVFDVFLYSLVACLISYISVGG